MENINIPEKYRIFDGAALKLLAIITMLIDHTAKGLLYMGYLTPRAPIQRGTFDYTLLKLYPVLRGIGRVAFPIFCFFLVQGFLYTRSRKKYLLRLIVFALVSELPFDLALHGKLFYKAHQNVFFTLALGLLMLCLWEWIPTKVHAFVPAMLLNAAQAGALMYAAQYFHTDYRYKGLIVILAFYLLHFHHPLACLGGAVAMYWEWPWVLLAFPPLLLYNGKRGKQAKYFFYAFYPAHLIAIYLIRTFILLKI